MGEIPERRTFRHPVLKTALLPYLEIVQGSSSRFAPWPPTNFLPNTAVRIGDLTKFNLALTSHAATFAADSTGSLILRLRHNVIKTALRTISLAYSRISLRDVSAKLHLDSEEDAEYIVAKAIRDGVIDAVVDHEKGFMQSREQVDVYATSEPQIAFDTRIKFLLELHNQSVKVRPLWSLVSALGSLTLSDLVSGQLGHALPAQRPLEGARVGWRGPRA